MSVTYSFVILPHLRKEDGSNFIRIRITHARKSKYIKTDISVLPEDFTRSGTFRNQGKEDLVRDEIKKMRAITDQIPTFTLSAMSADDVVEYIKTKLSQGVKFRLDFIQYGKEQAAKMKKSTGKMYVVALNCLAGYFGRNPDINELTLKEIRNFEQYVRDRAPRSVLQYLTHIKAIYSMARMQFNEPDLDIMRIPVNVFDYYKMPKKPIYTHRDIPREYIQMMIDQRKGLTGAERVAIDTFLISFCLMGMNAEDMHNAQEKPQKDIIHYYRTKTTDTRDDQAEMYVRIEPCVKEIIKDYLGKARLFNYYLRFKSTDIMTSSINKGIRKWIARNRLEDFTFYSARHTWGTMAGSKEAGIDSKHITEGMCHAPSNKMDKVYVRTDWRNVWDANAKVLSLLRW